MAIGEVGRQILATATFPGGVPYESTYQLIAGYDVGDDIGGGPSLAQRSLGPATGGERIDRLQVPVAGLSEPAWLCFHLAYLTAFRLTPLRRPDRSGNSDSLSCGSGFCERSIDFQGSSRPRSQSEMFRMPTPSGRSS